MFTVMIAKPMGVLFNVSVYADITFTLTTDRNDPFKKTPKIILKAGLHLKVG